MRRGNLSGSGFFWWNGRFLGREAVFPQFFAQRRIVLFHRKGFSFHHKGFLFQNKGFLSHRKSFLGQPKRVLFRNKSFLAGSAGEPGLARLVFFYFFTHD